MRKHVTILAWLHIAHAILLTCVAVIVSMVLYSVGFIEGLFNEGFETFSILTLVAFVVSFSMMLLAVPSYIAGIGLLNRRPWARTMTAVLGILGLFLNFPVGTAVGIYTIFVLFNKDTDAVFEPAGRNIVNLRADESESNRDRLRNFQ